MLGKKQKNTVSPETNNMSPPSSGVISTLALNSVLPFSNTASFDHVKVSNIPRYAPLADVQVESSKKFLLESVFPFLAAGSGMVSAGILLEKASDWTLFTHTPELYILVPSLLGLKGNLEMTMASRLSTMANLDQLQTRKQQWKVAYTNLALTQAQAVIVSFIAALFAVVVTWIDEDRFDYPVAAMLCAISITTASIASLLLGLVMILVVMACKRLRINPDNIATPIAAALGDLMTLALLVGLGTGLQKIKEDEAINWINSAIFVGLGLFAPLWMYIATKAESTRIVLKQGWWPVLCAMAISSGAGFVLKSAMLVHPHIGAFGPVINGVGGNLVAVQASRISTAMYRQGKMGQLPDQRSLWAFVNPIRAFFSSESDSVTARILLAMSLPGHALFFVIIIAASAIILNVYMALAYLISAFVQVSLLLYICQLMVRAMWRVKIEPDSSAIPLLTALGDLFGTGLLALGFVLIGAQDRRE